MWSNGNAVVLVELGVDGDTKNKFYGFLGTSAKKMKNAWMKKMLAGEGQAPDALDSEDAVLQKVASTPGAIGYVSKAKAGANVKILLEIN
ncbi:MAG: hypothetical protein GY863_23775 [bacterium]|nr:hypothetical protein [bacterium]